MDSNTPHSLDSLLDPERIHSVVGDCAQLIRDQAKQRSGLSGMAIKGGLKVIDKVRPTIIEDVMRSLLPEFIERLKPIYSSRQTSDEGELTLSLEDYLIERSGEVISALLAITDLRAERSRLGTLVSVYRKLRPLAEESVHASIPALAALLQRHGIR